MLFLADHLVKGDEGGAALGERCHAAGFLLEKSGDGEFSKAGAEHPVEVGRNTASLDMAKDCLANFLLEFRTTGGNHALNKGVGIADTFGKHDDGVIPGLLVAFVQLGDDPLDVAVIFGDCLLYTSDAADE